MLLLLRGPLTGNAAPWDKGCHHEWAWPVTCRPAAPWAPLSRKCSRSPVRAADHPTHATARCMVWITCFWASLTIGEISEEHPCKTKMAQGVRYLRWWGEARTRRPKKTGSAPTATVAVLHKSPIRTRERAASDSEDERTTQGTLEQLLHQQTSRPRQPAKELHGSK